MSLWTTILVGLSIIAAATAEPIVGLPNLDPESVCWKQASGYLPATNGHQLFYWYHEAVSSPQTKPVVLWLNGGPGCSSLGGMFTELGPFVLEDASLKMTLNPYSFNKVANMLFIEQPAGVGFSHPNVPANDNSTAVDTVAALRSFLKVHEELQGRDFYVIGESYGGHYVPNTAKQIQISNAQLLTKNEQDEPPINLKGFAVGNGYTDWHLDFNANVENGRYHALTSQSAMDKAKQACNGDYARCFWPRQDVECPEDCAEAVHAATTHATDHSIDIYDIYNDVCLQDGQERLETQLTTFLSHRQSAIQNYWEMRLSSSSSSSSSTTSSAALRLRRRRQLRATISPVFPTCIDAFTQSYLNLPDVQKAIHVQPDTIPNGQWSDCGNVEYTFNYESELDNYKEWTSKGDLNILIYNGDTDYILSHMGNAAWINQGLQLDKSKDWTMWRGSDGQVAGYFEQYKTGGLPMTFLTIKGAGHMTPRDRPRHSLDMFEKFITGGKYDQVKKTTAEPLCPAADRN